ncbi:hypothetical protein CTI14_72295, partial [Methylobacterium radiotolerans]
MSEPMRVKPAGVVSCECITRALRGVHGGVEVVRGGVSEPMRVKPAGVVSCECITRALRGVHGGV